MGAENVRVDYERAKTAVERCLLARRERKGIFRQELVIPEAEFIRNIKALAEKTGDLRLPMNGLFGSLLFDFAQKSKFFWRRIGDPAAMQNYYHLFQPEKVATMDPQEAFAGFLDYYGVSPKYYGPAIRGAIHNHRVLHEKHGDDVRNLFNACGNDVEAVTKVLVVRDRAKSNEKEFLRYGRKLTAYFLQLTKQYELYPLVNTDKMELPVDLQLARFLVQTGALKILEGSENAFQIITRYALPVFLNLCKDNGWDKQQVSETIWLVCSNCCSYNRHGVCPVNDICEGRMPSGNYYNGGRFVSGGGTKENWQIGLEI